MPDSWKDALQKYCYPADLRRFAAAGNHPGWFELNICPGDPLQTLGFETRFREQALDHREAWAEVVFWKLYSTGLAKAAAAAEDLLVPDVSAEELWVLCMAYVEKPDRVSFRAFRRKLGFTTPVVATAATFPAFIRPQVFPMVDTQIARWAIQNHDRHRYSDVGGPDLQGVESLPRAHVLKESHWPFVESWVEWCRFTAGELCRRTGRVWRARDVEMAVFTAQRCGLSLNPLALESAR